MRKGEKTNLKFYNTFAQYHDIMLPVNERLNYAGFLKYYFGNLKGNILDCACGTGVHLVFFAKMGFKISGSDISSGMLDQAKKNLKTYGVKSDLKICDFRLLERKYKKESFDSVVCLGNSLPHLFGKKNVIKALKSMRGILKKGGKLIISLRNYDKLISQKKKYDLIDKDDNIFLYIYEYLPNKLVFNIITSIKDNKKIQFKTFRTEYNPILKKDLENYLLEAGFKDILFFGFNEKTKYTLDIKNDDHYFVVAER